MQLVFQIFVAIFVFGLIILIHEAGHFLAAKKMGIRVNEFAIGMGPVLFKKQKGETQYAIRLLPIGGFVSMEGEDEDSHDENAFCNKKVWQKIVVVAAGAFMNILLGFLILLILVNMSASIASTKIARFNDGATSSQVLQVDDEIIKINGNRIFIDNDIIFALLRDQDGLVDMEVERNGERVQLQDVPFTMEEYSDGSKSIAIDFKVYPVEKTVGSVIKQALLWPLSIIRQVLFSVVDLVTGNFQLNQLSGPVGVGTAIGQSATMGLRTFLLMVAFITINIGVFNLLPLPALDGGRLVFLIVEGIRGKPVSPKYEGMVHTAGLLLLLGVVLFVTFNDIQRLFTGLF